MAQSSIPARAREFGKLLDAKKVEHTYEPADSPGGSHAFYCATLSGKPFTVLVERSDITVFDAFSNATVYTRPDTAVLGVVTVCVQQ
jgi:hypothetical protein